MAALGLEVEDFEEEEVWAKMNNAGSERSRTRRNATEVHQRAAVPRGGGRPEPPWHSSAPISVPDWSKILNKPSRGGDDQVQSCDDDDVVPPHEYLARRRRVAGSQTASFSMCEGVGRTLKGRDLSNLRNAILTKTGFIESR